MRWNKQSHSRGLLPLILLIGLGGCSISHEVQPLSGGYEEVTTTRTSWEPPAQRSSLQYRKGSAISEIWPDTGMVHVKNDIALFSGYAAYRRPQPHDSQDTELRLFIVKVPAPPLDITDEILREGSRQSGRDLAKLLKTASLTGWKQNDDQIEFHFACDGPDLNISLDWDQILDLMRDVLETGIAHKDPITGATYIEKQHDQKPGT